jgi:hypothetical protein
MINWIKININELVNKDGTRIGSNNVQIGQNNSKSASNSTSDPMYDPEDGDQLKNAVSQQRQNGYRGWKATMLLPMPQAISYMSDEDEKTGKKSKEKIKKSSKKKMGEMVEDIVNKKFSKEVLDKVKINGDINKNGVPDIEIISDENPLLVRKVKNLIDIISKNQATGEQKGMILNYLINNIGSTDIPMEYKSEMLKKLR